ncbi:flavodoxin family protein [Amycolatopsis acidicola]|uniref:FMN dependent NADH:quinone oxidoreductase n=1 Tax=Amycolatopsis acidicola TaxID=2596893 RepID=A0A5N0V723_9PSEU|nr:NAD(P)H-dependent oxidoreductase [Amycolatopsis acidicola]KAA9160870.1 flavodoxin family protein [Amycolatopsis acidicola]
MSLFRLDASIRLDGSHSREVADIVEREWRAAHPGEQVVTRNIGLEPLPSDAWANAVGAGATPESERTPAQREAVALAAEITSELLDADALLFAVPLYNFGVSQHFKAWVDLVFTDPRMAPGTEPALAGKPGVLVTVRGGNYSPGTPREGWDHAIGWIERILVDNWRVDLSVVTKEFTLVGVNPALDQFKDAAAELHAEAENVARQHGKVLAG